MAVADSRPHLAAAVTEIAGAGDPSDEATAGAPLAVPTPASPYPMLLGAQYTHILQQQSNLHAPYSGPLSLNPNGDTQPTNAVGAYSG